MIVSEFMKANKFIEELGWRKLTQALYKITYFIIYTVKTLARTKELQGQNRGIYLVYISVYTNKDRLCN